MKILVLGSGAREHALAWRLARDGHVMLVAPGNPGAARVATLVPLDPLDPAAVVSATRTHAVDLVVVGPEAPLVAGVVDALVAAGIAVFGPTAAAARLEGSKAFAKEFMARHGIATAPFAVCDDEAAAGRAIERFLAAGRVVLKADGLAAGKGVLVTGERAEARAFARDCLAQGRFGAAGARLVVEAFLPGEEVSLFFLSDGVRVRRFVAARDFKRLGDGDLGPNTGGMGAHAPADLDPALAERIEQSVALPTIAGMAREGAPFRGLLYVGLMLGPDGPRVLEYNARFGDPETQVLVPLVAGDLGALLAQCANGSLTAPLAFHPGATVGVVLAAAGYPAAPRAGDVVHGLASWPAPVEEDEAGVWCFHAGTRQRADGALVTAGGRVVTIVARAADRATARARAYAGVTRLSLDGGQVRHDVAREGTAWSS
ncbi:MAG: phosphoribosylamine--glycine ligase [Candidatus Eisenbacteria bacterium]